MIAAMQPGVPAALDTFEDLKPESAAAPRPLPLSATARWFDDTSGGLGDTRKVS
jgi:hypothetical protein